MYKKVLHRIATFIQINIFAGCFDEASVKIKRTLRLSECKGGLVRALLSESND
ncbi:MAG: hypothetical protein AB2L20_20785 [Mangrovibacterium sp.]